MFYTPLSILTEIFTMLLTDQSYMALNHIQSCIYTSLTCLKALFIHHQKSSNFWLIPPEVVY